MRGNQEQISIDWLKPTDVVSDELVEPAQLRAGGFVDGVDVPLPLPHSYDGEI